MARPQHVLTAEKREAHQRRVNAAPRVAEHPGVSEISIDLAFSDPEGKQKPSPRGVLFAGDMHAYFYFTCPMRDCTGGGFDADADLQKAMKRKRDGHIGHLTCTGVRPRGGAKAVPCNIELRYTLAIRMKAGAEAA